MPDATRASDRAGGRMIEADLLRVVAMVSVVAIHAMAWAAVWDAPARVVYPALDTVLRFGVPAFVLLTGYVMTVTRLGRPLDRGRFARARLRRVLVPFLVWGVIYIACALVFTPVDAPSVAGIPLLIWDGTVAGHLYFLPVALQLYLLFAVVPRTVRAVHILAAVAVPLQVALVMARTFAPPLGGHLAWAEGDHAQWVAVWFIGIYALGALLGAHRTAVLATLRRHPAVMALPLLTGPVAAVDVLHAGVSGYDAILRIPTLLHAVAVAIAILAAGARFEGRLARGRRVEAVAQRALGVYLVHPLVLTCLGRATQLPASPVHTDGDLVHSLPTIVAMVAATTGISLLAVGGLARLPFGWALAGRAEATGGTAAGRADVPAVRRPAPVAPVPGRPGAAVRRPVLTGNPRPSVRTPGVATR